MESWNGIYYAQRNEWRRCKIIIWIICKVEKAFKLYDEDKDGHLDWLEFIASVDSDVLT